MEEEIDIKTAPKAAVLMALYKRARPQGLGFLAPHTKELTEEAAEELLKSSTYFDYLNGRVMKVDLSGDTLSTWLFDRDNGPGAAKEALTEAGLI